MTLLGSTFIYARTIILTKEKLQKFSEIFNNLWAVLIMKVEILENTLAGVHLY